MDGNVYTGSTGGSAGMMGGTASATATGVTRLRGVGPLKTCEYTPPS